MPFLPSLLEYSPQDLQTKLELIKQNPTQFQTIQKSIDDKLYLHLDFVLPEFAKARNVQPGNSPEIVFNLIHQYFQDQKVVCNCHFMGTKGDTDKVKKFFETYDWNPNWQFILYVGQEFVNEFEALKNSFKKIPLLKEKVQQGFLATYCPWGGSEADGVDLGVFQIKIGAWLDLDQYSLDTKFELQDYLLMTVFAGKSGQKLTEEVRLNTLELVQKNPNTSFTIDGGWAVIDELSELTLEQKNKLNIVSYSSFWKKLENKLANI